MAGALFYPVPVCRHTRRSVNAKTVRRRTSAPPTFLCPLFHPRIMSVRTGQLGKFIYRAMAQTRPENCTTGCFALPLLHRFAHLVQEGPHQCRDNATTTTGGQLAHRGREGRSYGFWRRNRRTLIFHLCFLGASYCPGGG